MNHAENKNIWSKMKEKLHKYSFLGCLLLAGIVFFTWTDNWQVYTEPLQETYTKGVLLAEQLVEGKWPGISGEQSDATGSVSGNVPGENVQTGDTVSDGNQTDQTMGTVQSPATGEEAAMPETTGTETQDPAATVPVEEIPQEVVYHTVDDSYFDDAVFIGDSRTVGMYEYGGLEETSTFYASTGLTVYKMFDSAIVSVPGQKKKITVEEALSEKQFAKIYLMIGINEMGTGTVESFMKAYGEAVQHLQELQPDAVIYLQAIMKVTTERSEQGDYITNEGIEARNAEIAKLADDRKIFFLDVNPLICDEMASGATPKMMAAPSLVRRPTSLSTIRPIKTMAQPTQWIRVSLPQTSNSMLLSFHTPAAPLPIAGSLAKCRQFWGLRSGYLAV